MFGKKKTKYYCSCGKLSNLDDLKVDYDPETKKPLVITCTCGEKIESAEYLQCKMCEAIVPYDVVFPGSICPVCGSRKKVGIFRKMWEEIFGV